MLQNRSISSFPAVERPDLPLGELYILDVTPPLKTAILVIAELDRFIYATRQRLSMYRLTRHLVLILLLGLLGVVLLAPLFECFDQSKDLEQGTDVVFVILSVFVSTGLFILCKRIACLPFRSLFIATVSADTLIPFSNRPLEVEISPPESLVVLGSLRI